METVTSTTLDVTQTGTNVDIEIPDGTYVPIESPISVGTQPQEYWLSAGAKASDVSSGDKYSPLASIAHSVSVGETAAMPYAIHTGAGTFTFTTDLVVTQVGSLIEGVNRFTTALALGSGDTCTYGVKLTGARCTLRRLSVNCSAGTATYCVGTTAGSSAERTTYEDIETTGGQYGFGIGPDVADDIAATALQRCSSLNASVAGFIVGDGTSGNVLNTHMTNCEVIGAGSYAVEGNGGNFVWENGDVENIGVADFYIGQAAEGPYKISGVRSEGGQALLKTVGGTGENAIVRLSDITWIDNAVATGGSYDVINGALAGSLIIDNVSIFPSSASSSAPRITWGGQTGTAFGVIHARGLQSNQTAPDIGTGTQLFGPAGSGDLLVICENYQQIDQTGAVISNTPLFIATWIGGVKKVLTSIADAGVVVMPPPTAFAAPVNPAPGPLSTTLVMAGIDVTFTPQSTGKVLVTITGMGGTETGPTSMTLQGHYGTGTPPVNNGANVGATFPQGTIILQPTVGSTTPRTSFTLVGTLTGLTVGTAYWVDICFGTNTAADAAVLQNIVVSIQECT